MARHHVRHVMTFTVVDRIGHLRASCPEFQREANWEYINVKMIFFNLMEVKLILTRKVRRADIRPNHSILLPYTISN